MRTRQEIIDEIAALKGQMEQVKGTETEVYTRIVGYYRSLKNWNRGKKEEYFDRKLFRPGAAETADVPAETVTLSEVSQAPSPPVSSFTEYRFYHKKQCPNCIPMKAYLQTVDLEGKWIDVDSPEGLNEAMDHGVMSTPTVIFFDSQGNPVFRCEKPSVIKDILDRAEQETEKETVDTGVYGSN
jgi:ribonucleoside-triphosphate reductase